MVARSKQISVISLPIITINKLFLTRHPFEIDTNYLNSSNYSNIGQVKQNFRWLITKLLSWSFQWKFCFTLPKGVFLKAPQHVSDRNTNQLHHEACYAHPASGTSELQCFLKCSFKFKFHYSFIFCPEQPQKNSSKHIKMLAPFSYLC